MAWNDPPSFDYQQLPNAGRKFKHRYVNSETNLGQSHFQQQAPPMVHQSLVAPYGQHQPQDPSYNRFHQNFDLQQPFGKEQSSFVLGSNYTTITSNGSAAPSYGQAFSVPPPPPPLTLQEQQPQPHSLHSNQAQQALSPQEQQ